MATSEAQMEAKAETSIPSQSPQQTTTTTTATVEEKSATCKYRWGKVLPTNAKRVIFFCSAHPNEPVFLHWCPQQGAYYSQELHVPCGDYAGHVIVEGKTLPVEAFGVRSYTFEVDLFLKEDVIEDEVATSNSEAQELKFQQQQQQQGLVDTYRDISSSALAVPAKMDDSGSADNDSNIRHNSKYEDLLRQQLQHKESLDASLECELTMSQRAEQLAGGSSSKRLTPVGDIDKEPLQDGFSSLALGDANNSALEPGLSGRSLERRTPQNTFSRSASELRQDYEIGRHTTSLELNSSSRLLFEDASAGDAGLLKSLSRSGSDLSGGVGSGHVTPKHDSYEGPSGARPGSTGTHTPVDRKVEDVLGGTGSRSSSVRHTPTKETIGDVLGSEAILASPARSLASGSARQTPERDPGLTGSSRGTPQQDLTSAAMRGSQERLYGSQELLRESGSRPGSQLGSRAGSRPGSVAGSQHESRAQSLSSLTSEQELSQFLDINNSHARNSKRSTPLDTHPDESSMLPPIMRDRPSSLPTHATQSPVGLDKRAYTPDNAWSAAAAGGMGDFHRDLPPRGTGSRSALSSRASSRTVTPVPAGMDREEGPKVRDLEETVATLRKLLTGREQEVHKLQAQLRDFKEINQSLKSDLDHSRSRRVPSGPEELERQYEQLLQEKEILAGEVVKLRDRLESTRGTGVDSFSSQSSTSMQRRIGELEAHVKDLRHSHDSATQRLLRSEKRVKEVTEENEKLRASASSHSQDLHHDDRGRHYQVEVQQLKEDVRTLRERNYALQEEILCLREGREPSKPADFRGRGGEFPSRELASGRVPLQISSARSDEGPHQRPGAEPSFHDRHLDLKSWDHHHSRPNNKHPTNSDPLTSPRHRLDRSYGSDNFPSVSSREPFHRSLDRSFGSDQGTRDVPKETSSYFPSRAENGDREHKLSSDRLAKYRDFSEVADLRRTANRYDLLRSRPDGEVSEKVHGSDAGGRYGGLSAEKLRSLERGGERGESKVAMSSERLRILEEAERNRERRVQAVASSLGRLTLSANNPISSKEFYHSVQAHFGPSKDVGEEREKYSTLYGSLPSSLDTDKSTLSEFFATNDNRQKKSEANHSDDSDSTSILMSLDVKADTFSGRRELREKSGSIENSHCHEMYYDQAYLMDREQEKQLDRELRESRSHNPPPRVSTNGDDSDTATDILLSAEASKMTTSSLSHRRRHHHHHRRPSVDDASLSSLSDGDDPQDSLRRRSKSADPKGKKNPTHFGQTISLRPSSSTEMLGGGGGGKTVTLSAGFRTVTPTPLTTQHNKNAKVQRQQDTLTSSVTQGLRPFAPRSPSDVRVGDMVKFSRQGGKLSQGSVKFVGHLPGRSDAYVGVELYKEVGVHDGEYEGIRYFRCKPNKGVFVAFNKVVMAWAPN